MRKFGKSLAVISSGVALASLLGAGTAAGTDATRGQNRVAVPAEYSCYTEAIEDARVRIKCIYVNRGKVRGYAVCAGVDSNIATRWISAYAENEETTSTAKCRWGIRSHYVEAEG